MVLFVLRFFDTIQTEITETMHCEVSVPKDA